jgi:hypothetical protein
MKRGPKPSGNAKTPLERQQDYQRRLKAATAAWVRTLLSRDEDKRKVERLETLIAEARQISNDLNQRITEVLKATDGEYAQKMLPGYENRTDRLSLPKTDLFI